MYSQTFQNDSLKKARSCAVFIYSVYCNAHYNIAAVVDCTRFLMFCFPFSLFFLSLFINCKH